MSSNELCKACTLLEGLERGMANSGIVSHFRLSFVFIFLTNMIHYDPLSRLTGHARNLKQKAQPQIIYGRYRTLTLHQETQTQPSPSKHRHSDSREHPTSDIQPSDLAPQFRRPAPIYEIITNTESYL
jgi:Zinc-ribbon